MKTNIDQLEDGLSIGALSRATGLGVERIRMWERRYGSPRSLRRPSGHRRYPTSEVERLRLAKAALGMGYRAGDLAAATIEELKKITASPLEIHASAAAELESWFDSIRRLDEDFLSSRFHETWTVNGPLKFLTDFCAPFLKIMGEKWARGELSIAEEHFASERLNDFLAATWRRMNSRQSGPPFVLATLPGDNHRLGIQMCAVVVSLANGRVVFLGPSTPIEEIIKAAARSASRTICLSISSSVDHKLSRSYLRSLLQQLPASILVVCGGDGSQVVDELLGDPTANRLTRFRDLPNFLAWTSALVNGTAISK